jgi:hypothetical protein
MGTVITVMTKVTAGRVLFVGAWGDETGGNSAAVAGVKRSSGHLL